MHNHLEMSCCIDKWCHMRINLRLVTETTRGGAWNVSSLCQRPVSHHLLASPQLQCWQQQGFAEALAWELAWVAAGACLRQAYLPVHP